jgi:phosphatidylglycerophosphate synthase
MLQIVLGGICIVLSLFILAYIGPAILTIILILSIVLLVVGIERISVGISMPSSYRRLRFANIGIGLLIIAFSIVLMQFPVFTSAVLVVLAAIALLVSGISRIIQDISQSFRFVQSFPHRRRSPEYCSINSSDSTTYLLRVGSICYYDFDCISN